MKRVLLLTIGVWCSVFLAAQKTENSFELIKNVEVLPEINHGETMPLRDYIEDPNAPNEIVKFPKPGYHPKHDWGTNPTVNPDALPKGLDHAYQTLYDKSSGTRAPIVNYNGMGYTSVNPADPCVDASVDHVIQMINGGSGSYFTIYNKTGGVVRAQTYFDNFFGFPGGAGDPIVLYDELAGRWLMSEFSATGNNFYVAVSTTGDPMGTWYTYTFNAPQFPDYPKYSIWNNAYVITTNESSAAVYALDRTKMLAGLAATSQRVTMTNFGTIGFQAAAPVSLNGTALPPSGTPAMVMRIRDDAWTGSSSDAIELWEFNIDWTTPSNTGLSLKSVLPVAAYDSELCGYTSFQCIPQQGSSVTLDPLRELLMNRVHYRNFGTHESIVCCHVTDVDGTDWAGIRWYELRRTGGVAGTWTIYQEGTYAPDNKRRWMPSIAISATGQIGLAYNVSSSTSYPSLRYTGRKSCDPLGQMTEPETSIIEGTAANNSNRWGDYGAMSYDPADGETFWFTGTYNAAAQWSTRITSFKINSCTPMVQFGASNYSVYEANANTDNGCLDYIELLVPISIGSDPSQPADVTVNVTGGTATLNQDYTISNTSFTFDGTTLSGNVIIHILNDDIVEGNETITLDYTLNANGGDATTGSMNQTVTITINDDDLNPANMTNSSVVFSHDFESGLAPFTTVNPSTNTPWQIGNTATASSTAYAVPASNTTQFAWINDDACNCTQNAVDLIFPVVDLTNYISANVTFSTYFEDNTYQSVNENADLMVSVNGGAYTTVGALVASQIDVNWVNQNFDISAYVGNASVRFLIRYSDGGGWLYGCTVDDVVITGQQPITVQTAVNTNLGDTANLGPNATVHFYDPNSSNVMMTISNTSAFDYGCVIVEVDRDGTAPTALQFNSTNTADYLHSKTFKVTPTNTNPAGTFDVTLYYKEAEVAAWESATGRARSEAEIIKVAGNNRINDVTPANYTSFTINNVLATIGAFNSDVTFSASFSNGFSGLGVGVYNTATTVSHSVVVTDPLCNGDNNGSIVITASGGTAPYQYSIDGGTSWQASNTFSSLSSGTYQVQVQDAGANPSAISSETLNNPSIVAYSATIIDPTCTGNTNGTINLSGSGGTGTLQYSIDNGVTFQTSGSFTGLSAGSFNVVIQDANNCQTSGTEMLNDPSALTYSEIHSDLTCNSGTDGTITLSGSGGTGAITYSIDNGTSFQASGAFGSLSAGSYDIVVQDANNCQSTGIIDLTEPAAVGYSESHNDPLCNGDANGDISLNGSGGTGAFSYSIDNGVTFQASGIFTGLSAATYNIVVRDASNCQASGTIALNNPSALNFNTAVINATCGNPNGSITINATGGTGSITYSIDGGTTYQVSNNFPGLVAGNYSIVIMDANNCTYGASQSISNTAGPAISSVTRVNPTCNGGTNGALTVNSSGGTAPLTYSIDGGTTFQSANNFTGLSAGTYNVVVQDGNNCQANTTATLTAPSAVSYSATITDETCGGANGSFAISGTGGTGALQYSIDGGTTFQVTGNFTGLSAGNYNIVVKDANNCQATGTETIGSSSGVSYSSITITDPTCNNGLDGSIVITATGGSGPYSYSIDGGASFGSNNNFTGLSAGNYSLSIMDANNCSSDSTVAVNNPTAWTTSASTTGENCGTNNGSITITATGGAAPLQYSIDGGTTYQMSNIFAGVAAGLYSTSVLDNNGCSVTGSANVASIGGANIDSIAITNVSCNGLSDGQLIIYASGGNPPYAYSVDGGATAQISNTFTGLTAGSYAIRVGESGGCITSGSAVITQPIAINFTTTLTDPSCFNGSNGSIVFSATGGTNPKTYAIDGGITFQSSTSFTGLIAGTYNLVVRDNNGCTATNTINLNSPAQVNYTGTTTDENCGVSDGSITLSGSGGNGVFSYSIDGGVSFQSSGVFSNLASGNYNIVVKDGKNCQATGVETVNGIGGAILDSLVVSEVTCNGAANGSIVIYATGGVSPLNYSIDGGGTWQSSNSFGGLSGGNYAISIEDAALCATNGNTSVNEPSALIFTTSTTDENCGSMDGSVTISASGGTSPFLYSIDGGSSFTSNNVFAGLSAQNYSVLVNDDNSCTANALATVNGAGGPTIDNIVAVDLSCYQSSDGSISITASGGSAPLSFSIDNGGNYQSGGSFSGLNSGSYSIIVMDNAGCLAISSIDLTEPTELTYSSNVSNENCGAADGSITINATGGSGTYQYSIDNGSSFQASNVFVGLSPAIYTIVVEDSDLCSTGGTVAVGSDGGVMIDNVSATDVSCGGTNDGSITITASAGTSPYNYSVDGGTTFVTSSVFNNLAPGNYDVVVNDASGCVDFSTVFVNSSTPLSLNISVTDVNCGQNDGSVFIDVSGGSGIYTYTLNGVSQTSGLYANLASGNYSYTVNDGNGCNESGSIPVFGTIPPVISNVSISTPNCFGEQTGAIGISASGNGTLSYSIDGGNTLQSASDFSNIDAGSYLIAVQDNNCMTTQVVTITEPAILEISTYVQSATCGLNNGIAVATANGGTQNYSYNWGIDSTNALSNIGEGWYQVVVTDANGCLAYDSVFVSNSDSLMITVDVIHESCKDKSDGEINTIVTGGAPDYQYTWSNGSSSANIGGLTADDYRLTVTDADGCKAHMLIPIYTLNEDCIHIPTAISPNGDGSNDTWIIEGLELYPYANIEIYNRWGSLLFSSNEYNHDWDATYQGVPLPAGVYYFVIVLNEDENYTGSITVLR